MHGVEGRSTTPGEDDRSAAGRERRAEGEPTWFSRAVAGCVCVCGGGWLTTPTTRDGPPRPRRRPLRGPPGRSPAAAAKREGRLRHCDARLAAMSCAQSRRSHSWWVVAGCCGLRKNSSTSCSTAGGPFLFSGGAARVSGSLAALTPFARCPGEGKCEVRKKEWRERGGGGTKPDARARRLQEAVRIRGPLHAIGRYRP